MLLLPWHFSDYFCSTCRDAQPSLPHNRNQELHSLSASSHQAWNPSLCKCPRCLLQVNPALILLGGSHCSVLGCKLGQRRGLLAATGHGAPGAGGERRGKPLSLHHTLIPSGLAFWRDLIKAKVFLQKQRQRGSGIPWGTAPAWGERAPSGKWAWTPESTTAPPALSACSHPLNYCLIFIPLQWAVSNGSCNSVPQKHKQMGNWPARLHCTGVQCCCSSRKLLSLPLQNPRAVYEGGEWARLAVAGWLIVVVVSASCTADADWGWQAERPRCKETAVRPQGPTAVCRGPGDGGWRRRGWENMYIMHRENRETVVSSGTWADIHLHLCLRDGWIHKHSLWRKRPGDWSLS